MFDYMKFSFMSLKDVDESSSGKKYVEKKNCSRGEVELTPSINRHLVLAHRAHIIVRQSHEFRTCMKLYGL